MQKIEASCLVFYKDTRTQQEADGAMESLNLVHRRECN